MSNMKEVKEALDMIEMTLPYEDRFVSYIENLGYAPHKTSEALLGAMRRYTNEYICDTVNHSEEDTVESLATICAHARTVAEMLLTFADNPTGKTDPV
jgi:hypothetical protein